MPRRYVRHKQPARRHEPRRGCQCKWCTDENAPTPAQIAARCAMIQARWSERERRARIVCDRTRAGLFDPVEVIESTLDGLEGHAAEWE